MELSFGNIRALPLVHGRLAFAMEARRTLLAERWDAVAVELPPSLTEAVYEGLDALPRISTVLYRDHPPFLDPEGRVFYVPIDPSDGIIEALRIARGERTPIAFVDAEIQEFDARPLSLPDPHALHTLGLATYCELLAPAILLHPRTPQDTIRERHMAARLRALSERLGPDAKILFLCGLAHWLPIRAFLEEGQDQLHEEEGPAWIDLRPVTASSLPHLLGEIPWLCWRWEEHRAGWDPDDFELVRGLKDLLLEARERYEKRWPDSLEKATPNALRTLLDFLRKLNLRHHRLVPDGWSLAQAAKGCVGNDYAVVLTEVAHDYPPNCPPAPPEGADSEAPFTSDEGDEESAEDGGLMITQDRCEVDGETHPAESRVPGEWQQMRRLRLVRRPDPRQRESWKQAWNPMSHCSWPPEDVTIERFRDYVSKRALTLASLSLRKTEPFLSSFKDGLAMRETLRDWHQGKIHVKEEPPVAGAVGALVVIFEEDDDGMRFSWRTTWQAEHAEESTLAFYSTDPTEDFVGPGIGRIFYGGCLFIYPPIPMPDVWEDFRFEQARTPSERLLLAGIFWARERFVIHVAERPPSPEIKQQAQALGRHVIHLPLSTFSTGTLERLRRAHVLNGHQVRSWASRFIQ